jgi:hypothetical protein
VCYAEHYYGTMVNGRTTPKFEAKRVEVNHPLTASECAEANKAQEIRDFESRFKPGDLSVQFLKEEEVLEAAKQQWKEAFPVCQVLIVGSYGSWGHGCKILDGPEEFVTVGNAILKRCDDIDWWERDFEGMKPMEAEWKALFEKFKLEMR